MRAVIIDYGSGNLHSAAKAFNRAAAATGHRLEVVTQAEQLTGADHIILPGVGAFADCMAGLKAVPGMVEALEEQVRRKGVPFLGICVGMQLIARSGRENGTHEGLGWLDAEVWHIRSQWPKSREDEETAVRLKLPHMGWNELEIKRKHPVLKGIQSGDHAYFVHSYCMICRDQSDVLAMTEYGTQLTAVVGRDNMIGTQFHPEKSQETGLKLIENFLNWKG